MVFSSFFISKLIQLCTWKLGIIIPTPYGGSEEKTNEIVRVKG
jgi:hypothetical protein